MILKNSPNPHISPQSGEKSGFTLPLIDQPGLGKTIPRAICEEPFGRAPATLQTASNRGWRARGVAWAGRGGASRGG